MAISDLFSFRRRKRRAGRPRKPAPWAYFTDDGRRHLARVHYPLPKDAQENHRLDFQHCYLKWLIGRNYLAPVPPTLSAILDVGCGSGIWVRELAQEFPRAQVVGVDLELPPHIGQALGPGLLADLPNYEFKPANILEGLPFADQTFDFVHQRLLVAGIPPDRWQGVVQELARVTRKGGWVELFEGSTTFHRPGPATQRLLAWQARLHGQRGLPSVEIAPTLQTFLRVAGFKHIGGRALRVPLGNWGRSAEEKRAGGLLATDILAVLRSMQGWCCETLEIPPTEFAAVLDALATEWTTCKTAFDWYGAYGQRAG